MKAVGYKAPGAPEILEDIILPDPLPPQGRDLLVRIKAVSINPVDTKIRCRAGALEGATWRVLGWDAAGIVEAIGPDVTFFRLGDHVFYAGELMRQGSNAELQCVDETLVGHMPQGLDWGQAASLPLTGVTAWEMLFDRMGVTSLTEGVLLVVGGAGGVGSILIQLARKLTGLTVIATASRPETEAWVRRMGAHHVINHRADMAAQIRALGLDAVTHIASLTASDRHQAFYEEILAPQGHVSLIDDPASFDIMGFKRKSAVISWEFMFTRSLFATPDQGRQHEILEQISSLVQAGAIVPTDHKRAQGLNAGILRGLHEESESGTSIGKTVLVY
ncbi:zinc-binding alcohol dehydrogenase family protein [Asaia sp. W19]|uniref:zinc-binding alcohol dehydrogenase family protein n=1 Tax=unclassified Asaia TaxID=2685023 RepID=UPI000F8CD422|nr:zinc-binding alcohol dehydrogenase family protein [Asaia sp. W19]RUT25127.1 zinc-binding alcohol dehydrogenase family protein [Asaia sp. W19]